MTKRYSGDGTERPSVTIRWQPEVLEAASAAASFSQTSLNSFVNKAVIGYLAIPEVSAELADAQAQMAAAIQKLAGGPS